MKRLAALAFFSVLLGIPATPGATEPVRPGSFAAYLRDTAIEAFSIASSRGDQTAMTRLLDAKVIFSGGDGQIQRDPKRDATDAVAILLRRQTQLFRNASQRGDVTSMNALSDDRAIFINEDGVVSVRADVRRGELAPPIPGVTATITTSGFVVREAGAAAVTSFVDTRFEQVGDQLRIGRFLGVETWIERGTAWKLLASQVIPLYGDPLAAHLTPAQLDQYAGSYSAGPGYAVTIAHDGDGLTSSTNGSKPVVLKAEALDVLFTPGTTPGSARTRSVFERDASGAVSGYVSRAGLALSKVAAPDAVASASPQDITSSIAPASDMFVRLTGDVAVATFIHDRTTHVYAQVLHTRYRSTETWIKSGATWKMLALQSLETPVDPPAPPPIPVPDADAAAYAGIYTAGPHVALRIARASDRLTAATNGAPAVTIVCEAPDFFVPQNAPRTTLLFERDASGRITAIASRYEGRDILFSRQAGGSR